MDDSNAAASLSSVPLDNKQQSPIDSALTDLHNNIEDAHQLISDLEVKIGPVLGYDEALAFSPQNEERETSTNSRVHDAVREADRRVTQLHARIRDLIRRVEL